MQWLGSSRSSMFAFIFLFLTAYPLLNQLSLVHADISPRNIKVDVAPYSPIKQIVGEVPVSSTSGCGCKYDSLSPAVS